MKELHLQGWLCHNEDGLISLKASKNGSKYEAQSIQSDIFDFAKNADYYESPGLGGQRATIPNASIRVYATNKECSLDEATGALISHLYGCADSDIEYEGYSEYTITGYSNKTFTVGGHNLAVELERYLGKYVHFVLECDDEYATVTAESKPENTKYVYVLAIGSGSECSAVSFDVLGVFTSIDSAKENFNERRAAELPIVKNNGWEIYDDSDFYFDAGKDGYYDSNHITISLTKLKLQN